MSDPESIDRKPERQPITILSAAWANQDHTAAVVQTKEHGAVLVSLPDERQHSIEIVAPFREWLGANEPAPFSQER